MVFSDIHLKTVSPNVEWPLRHAYYKQKKFNQKRNSPPPVLLYHQPLGTRAWCGRTVSKATVYGTSSPSLMVVLWEWHVLLCVVFYLFCSYSHALQIRSASLISSMLVWTMPLLIWATSFASFQVGNLLITNWKLVLPFVMLVKWCVVLCMCCTHICVCCVCVVCACMCVLCVYACVCCVCVCCVCMHVCVVCVCMLCCVCVLCVYAVCVCMCVLCVKIF